MTLQATAEEESSIRRWLLIAIVAGAALISLGTLQLLPLQPPGSDFSVFWAGARTALANPDRVYDFAHVTGVLGWPTGEGELRPYAYPPSATLVFTPFALLPHWVAYGVFLAATLALFALGARRIAAPWWFLLLPTVAWVAYCGQVTFLIGGLAMLALSAPGRPVLAGLLLGVAAAIKPQLFLLLPIALLARRDWRTMAWTAVGGAALCAAATLVFGPKSWFAWADALPLFQAFIASEPELLADAVTPFAALSRLGLDGRLAYLLAPLATFAVWRTFRGEAGPADQLLALFGGMLLISPYAMGYEVGLMAPAVAIYLARRHDRAWIAYAVATLVYFCAIPLATLLAALSLPLLRLRFQSAPSALRSAAA